MPHHPDYRAESLCIATYPTGDSLEHLKNEEAGKTVALINEIATASRSIVSQLDIKKTEKPRAYLWMKTEEAAASIKDLKHIISVLGPLGELTLLQNEQERPGGCVMAMVNKEHRLFIEVKGLVDIGKEVSQE